MPRHVLHRLVALICVLATGFHAVAGGFVVQCTESDGTSHLEWGGCDGAESGGCTPCGTQQSVDPESGSPDPCQDEPVKSELGTANVRSARSLVTLDLPAPALAVILPAPINPLSLSVLARHIDPRAAAPPPAMASIRTIVMLV